MNVDIDLSKLTFLVIDDNAYARAFLRSTLYSLGGRSVLDVADVLEALDILRNRKVDLILVNHDMTPLDGVMFTRLVRDGTEVSCVDVPIIMVSGVAELDRVVEARNAGVNEFLVRPVSTDSLYRRVRNALVNPRPFVHSVTYVGPCRRLADPSAAMDNDRRVNPPLPRPKPLVDVPPGALAPRPIQARSLMTGQAPGAPIAKPTGRARSDKPSRKRFKAGTLIFAEGDPGDEAYVIETGKVCIFKVVGQTQVVLGELGDQGVFGEMALIDDQPRMACAQAVDDTMCLVIPKATLKAQIGKTPDLVILVVETLLHNIRKMGRELAEARSRLKAKRLGQTPL